MGKKKVYGELLTNVSHLLLMFLCLFASIFLVFILGYGIFDTLSVSAELRKASIPFDSAIETVESYVGVDEILQEGETLILKRKLPSTLFKGTGEPHKLRHLKRLQNSMDLTGISHVSLIILGDDIDSHGRQVDKVLSRVKISTESLNKINWKNADKIDLLEISDYSS